MEHTIELKKVSKYYAGKEQVSLGFSRIDLDLDMGEFVAITGESGSGKSTLLNIISGLDNYDEGEMFVCGEDTTGYTNEDYEKYRKKYIGNIFQDFNIVNSYTVYQNIELVMLLAGKKKSECRARIKELLETVGLSEYAKTKASRLSGGQKQRVAIARALAKDAPIIVADEPTGNLDSESADIVMKTLADAAKNKLVIIVTHNYEQAEPYVTRKLTMHDGRIIEDKSYRAQPVTETVAGAGDDNPAIEEYAAIYDELGYGEDSIEQTGLTKHELEGVSDKGLGFGGELSLGIRNTFNLPAKFLLLFIVYLFVATAIIAQYASVKSSLSESNLLDYNDYFTNMTDDRVVVTKQDHSSFTDEDIATLGKLDNVKYVVRNDLNLDRTVTFNYKDSYIESPIYPTTMLTAKSISAGRMPEKDDEAVLKCYKGGDLYKTIKQNQDDLLGKSFVLSDYATDTKMSNVKVSIVGIILVDDEEEIGNVNSIWTCPIYLSEEMSNRVLIHNVANSAKTTVNYYNTEMSYEDEIIIFPDKDLKKGEAYIFDDYAYYYPKDVAKGKELKLNVETSFFSEELKPTIVATITTKNIQSMLGIKKDEYEFYSNRVYVSYSDYAKLFDKGSYQASVFMEKVNDYEALVQALNSKGYNSLVLKNALSDVSDGFSKVIEMFTYLLLIVEVIILFFISYAVIRLIMKSRNSYYATLRILGASRRNTLSILRIELVIMMLIAYAVDIAAVVLIKKQIIAIKQAYTYLDFIQPYEYAILGATLIIMSIMIARRYSRKIFTSSAMKTFREGA